jgi:hypothetical protein
MLAVDLFFPLNILNAKMPLESKTIYVRSLCFHWHSYACQLWMQSCISRQTLFENSFRSAKTRSQVSYPSFQSDSQNGRKILTVENRSQRCRCSTGSVKCLSEMDKFDDGGLEDFKAHARFVEVIELVSGKCLIKSLAYCCPDGRI